MRRLRRHNAIVSCVISTWMIASCAATEEGDGDGTPGPHMKIQMERGDMHPGIPSGESGWIGDPPISSMDAPEEVINGISRLIAGPASFWLSIDHIIDVDTYVSAGGTATARDGVTVRWYIDPQVEPVLVEGGDGEVRFSQLKIEPIRPPAISGRVEIDDVGYYADDETRIIPFSIEVVTPTPQPQPNP